jgi:hypothetical protein
MMLLWCFIAIFSVQFASAVVYDLALYIVPSCSSASSPRFLPPGGDVLYQVWPSVDWLDDGRGHFYVVKVILLLVIWFSFSHLSLKE